MSDIIFGMDVIVNPLLPDTKPIIQLAVNFKWCSDEFREKQNKYLSDMFGSTIYYLIGKHPFNGKDVIITSVANCKLFENRKD